MAFFNKFLALMAALLQRLIRGEMRVPHIVLECKWTLPDGRIARWKRRLLLRWVAQATDRIGVYARHQTDAYSRVSGIPGDKFIFIPSHTTLYSASYAATEGDCIFSAGYTNRDYGTVLEAVHELPYRVVLCVRSRGALGPEVPAHVEVVENASDDEFDRLMAASACVVVPLRGGLLEAGGGRCSRTRWPWVRRSSLPIPWQLTIYPTG